MGILVYRDREGMRDYVGRIDYERGSSAAFTYDGAYLQRARENGELGISVRLPLDDMPYSEAEFGPFIQGLLPEGEVYSNLLSMYQTPRSGYLAMLERLGCESIGALTFVSEAYDPAEYEPHYEALSKEAVDAIRDNPIRAITLATSSTRLSLSGAQSKLAWFLPEGMDPLSAHATDWLVPRGTAPSTHIVKVARKGEEQLAENEHACSLLAGACGIEVARIFPLADIPGAIAVERYDRVFAQSGNGRVLLRLHQEDFCQALGFPPYLKYQPDSGEGEYAIYIADLIGDTSCNPREDRIEFAKRLLFNYAIGNTDAHLKNSSLLYNRQWTSRSLAPLYDVTCIPLTGYSTQMSFAFGAHRELAAIDEKDIVALMLDLEVSMSDADRVIGDIVHGFAAFEMGSAGECNRRALSDVLANSEPRIAVLERFLRG